MKPVPGPWIRLLAGQRSVPARAEVTPEIGWNEAPSGEASLRGVPVPSSMTEISWEWESEAAEAETARIHANARREHLVIRERAGAF